MVGTATLGGLLLIWVRVPMPRIFESLLNPVAVASFDHAASDGGFIALILRLGFGAQFGDDLTVLAFEQSAFLSLHPLSAELRPHTSSHGRDPAGGWPFYAPA